LIALVLALALALGLSAAADASPTGRLLVLLRGPGTARARAAAAEAVIARAGGRPAGPAVPQIGLLTVRPAPGRPLAALAHALAADPAVRSVQAEGRMQPRVVPNNPALTEPETAPGTPPGTPLQWPPGHIDLFHAWDLETGAGALVAVIDTGADATHPDLGSKIAVAVDQDANPGDGPATVDENGHGTHVASLACAATGSGIGIAGAGGLCRLIVEKSDLSDASIAASIVDATDRGALAINMSFGDSQPRPPVAAIVAALDYALAHQVVLVAAARDDRNDPLGNPIEDQGQPASLLQPAGTGPNPAAGGGLSVTASTIQDSASGAGKGSEISLAAPGSMFAFGSPGGPPGLLGVAPAGHAALLDGPLPVGSNTCLCRTTLGGATYAYLQGTSMSSPQVAAVAALVRRFNPDLPALEVVLLLKQTARRAAGVGWSADLGWGIVDAAAALEAAARIDRRPPVSRVFAPRSSRPGRFRIRWRASDPAPPGVQASGVAYVEVYEAVGARAYRRIARTRRTSMLVTGLPGHRYAFFSLAVDRAGNRQPRPRRPDAVTRVRTR
jgi:subtilisin family serine protease